MTETILRRPAPAYLADHVPAPDLVSGPEAAELLGVNKQRLHALRTGGSGFPPAVRATPFMWWRQDILDYIDYAADRRRLYSPKPEGAD